jgi:hypothetical protein
VRGLQKNIGKSAREWHFDPEEDGPVALGDFLGRRSRGGGGSSWQSRQGTQSSCLQALLVATKSSCRVAEAASNIVLIGISRFEQRHHGVGFRSGIIKRIVTRLSLPGRRILFVSEGQGRKKRNSELLTYPLKIVDGFGFIFPGANQNLSAFCVFL